MVCPLIEPSWEITPTLICTFSNTYRGVTDGHDQRDGIRAYNAESNRNLNYIDEEIEVYIKKYSTWPSEDLAKLSNSDTVGEKELLTIRKVLIQRHMCSLIDNFYFL